MPSMPGKSRGYFVETGPDGTVEHETFTCHHCQQLVVVPHRAAPDQCGGFCRQCWGMICTACAQTGRCTPFEKRLEQFERRERLRIAAGV